MAAEAAAAVVLAVAALRESSSALPKTPNNPLKGMTQVYNQNDTDGYGSAPVADNGLRALFGKVGLTVLILLLSQNLLSMPMLLYRRMGFLIGGGINAFAAALGSMVVYVTSMVLTIVIATYLFGCDNRLAFPMARVRRDYLLPALFAGLGAAMVGNLTSGVAMSVLNSFGVYSRDSAPVFGGGAATVITLISATLLPALFEEMLFRGVLLQSLRRYGDSLAVVASALVFAFCHPTLPQFINALIVGLCLGMFAVRTGSLRMPMAVHFVYNSVACVMALAGRGGATLRMAALSWAVIIVLLVAGAVGAIILKKRFGMVWRLPVRNGFYISKGVAWRAALTSLPLIAAVVLCAVSILRNLYTIGLGGLF